MFFSKDNTAKVASLFTDLLARLDVIVQREENEFARLNTLMDAAREELKAATSLRSKISDLLS